MGFLALFLNRVHVPSRVHDDVGLEPLLSTGVEVWRCVSRSLSRKMQSKTRMEQCQDPDHVLYIMGTTRDRLKGTGGYLSPERFGDLLLNALTPDDGFVRNISFIHREVGLEEIRPRQISATEHGPPFTSIDHLVLCGSRYDHASSSSGRFQWCAATSAGSLGIERKI